MDLRSIILFLLLSILFRVNCFSIKSEQNTEKNSSEEKITPSEYGVFRHKPPIFKPIYSEVQVSGQICPRYEEYMTCGPICEDECSKKCKSSSNGCKKGCFCINGYIRHSSGRCVHVSSCPKPDCPRFEEWRDCDSAPHCDHECGSEQKQCYGKSKCPGCFCLSGYYRHPITNHCVSRNDCPSPEPQCAVGEEYSLCGYASNEQCQWYGSASNRGKCKPGCYCRRGFVRIDGDCVPKKYCPKVCPANEEYKTCGKSCYEYCSKSTDSCENKQCESGCFCVSGYKRVNDVCVPKSKCPLPSPPTSPPSPKCSKPNEVYKTCGKSCDEDCSKTLKDCLYEDCSSGCYCKPHYKRVNGFCVPENQCPPPPPPPPPKCKGPNEVYSKCGQYCSELCDKKSYECNNKNCYEGCFCLSGYKRIDGICTPQDQCPPPPCGAYETYSDCGTSCNEQCGSSENICGKSKCYPGCFCDVGYKRIKGQCVSEDLCGCPENEELISGNSCKELCESGPNDCKDEVCSKGCYCKQDYRRIDGKCVPDSQCSCKKNEEYTYSNDCYDECESNPDTCRALQTYKKCSCINGYKRINGYCVPDSKCPCSPHEEILYTNDCYEKCGSDPEVCAQIETVRRCGCESGFVRINGRCVPEYKCVCSVNEEYTYGNPCLEYCKSTPDECKNIALYKRCSCQYGYKRYKGVCVPESNCICGENEIYKNGNQCYEDCTTTPSQCEQLPTSGGCYCKDGYKRINGLCVEYSNCVCGQNEYYDYGNECLESCGDESNCVGEVSYPRCNCLPFYKRIDGVCVPESNCVCPENEVQTVGNDCYDQCGTDPTLCATYPSTDRCMCKDGFKRINGTCVPFYKCPCGENEVYLTSNPCYEQCYSIPRKCAKIPSYGLCICQSGYVRIDGVCVPDSNCACPENEEYTLSSKCIEECAMNENTCTEEPTWNRCTCIDLYKRIDGQCVPDTECQCPPNEHMDTYNDCSEECGMDPFYCGSAVPTYRKCFCDMGYVRINGVCVEDTTVCTCPENEIYGYINDCLEDCSKTESECRSLYMYRHCGCAPNYKRIDGVCVPDSNCPCPENSAYSYGNDCYETCGTDPTVCAQMPSEKYCACNYGFVRLNGDCVDNSNCLCGENESYSLGNECREMCGDSRACVDAPVYERCNCITSYKRIDGVCVPETECPCPENEVQGWSNDCHNTCGTDPTFCANQPGFNGCHCKSGYRRVNGICIPYINCPCPENEIYLKSNDCYEQCGANPIDCAQMYSFGRCVCASGYVRIDRECVEDSNCICGENEEYVYSNDCIEECGADKESCKSELEYKRCTCIDQYKRINGICVPDTNCECPENEHMDNTNECFESCGTDPLDCSVQPIERRCTCNNGYVRISGTCVPNSDGCTCPENEIYKYSNDCYDDCSQNENNCQEQHSYERCACITGYKRIDGTCVPNTECPCPENSSYRVSNDCYETCGTDPAVCVAMDMERKCFCSEGYVRIDGNCVAESECPCGSNEEYTYGNENMEDCNNPDLDCRNEYSYKRCTCVENFKRIDGVCVPNTECPCPENSSYRVSNDCYGTCGTDPTVCVAMDMERKCFCSEGYVRIDGNCVAESECPCGSNEEYTYGNENMEDCNNPDLDCPNEYSYKRCTCVENFKRIDGVCVPNTECPCPEYSSYRVSNDCYETCGTDPAVCVAMDMERKCFCSEGYVRIDGNCVAESECPCGSNEEYTYGNENMEDCNNPDLDCRNEYSYKRCTCVENFKRIDGVCVPNTECPCPEYSSYRVSNDCYETCGTDPAVCVAMDMERKCFCSEGYVRIDGNCVAESECPCGSNEEYTYGNENMEDCNNPDLDCRNEYSYKRCTCVENFKRIDGVCVPNTECPCPENSSYRISNDCYETCGTDPAVCVAMDMERKCFCSEGYVRIDGNCVAESECPCGSNEEYTYGNENMEDCNNPVLDCPNEYSYKRCTCVENFKRIDGVCVPNTECPCPEYSSYRVSNDCYETCGTDPAVCVAMDMERKCFCSEGYVRIDGNCVAESECPCGSNEEYTYGNENMEDCNNPDLDCPNEYSYKRCTCVENFKRIDGVCVANTECPCPENSSYRISNDCYETCGTDPAVCVAMDMERKCFCSEGYVRIDGNCVAESECPCGSNEEYTYGNENMEDCNNPDLDCRKEYSYKKCTCVENFKRIDGVCVPNTECPCPENSSYRVSNDCYETCGTDPAVCVAMDMERKCFCSEGYVRIDGNCVAESECPCGSNEEYTYGNENMEDCNNPVLDCPNEYSYKRCTCVENFKRIDGVCVPNTECPCPENSSYRVSNDCYETCGTDPAVCVAMDMERKCFCSEGYVRINGNCVAESECPCGSNEEYTYGNENMEDCNNPDLDCRKEYSYKKCTCVENFKRIDGVCVPNTECPCPENSSYRVSNDCYETCGTDPAVCVAMDMERKCFCSEGYVRIDGNCVAESECPCGSNEEYTYGNENMEDCNNPDLDCRNEYSYKRCTCVENFKRIDGVCVPNTECPCPENSSYRVSNDCYETCGTNPAVCVAMDMERKCFCSEGYVRIDGNCVAESECPCGSNEEYTYGNENMEDCSNPDLDCRKEYSYKKCTCVENFKRIDGVCVPNTECPCPENSSYRVSNDCYETCGTDPAVCVAMDMERKCFCSEGYVRIDGNCVAESECPCGSNEEYTYGNENMEDCNNPDLDCRDEYSYKRCTCVENFKRIDGVCVPNTECPCPENSSYRVSNDCYETCGTDPAVCVAMDTERKCFCSEGYVRIDGNCVAESECPCGSNEEYTYGNENMEDCNNPDLDCRNEYSYKRCTCVENFKRIDGVCVANTECPCPENSSYRVSNDCYETCGTDPAVCVAMDTERKCFCSEGYVRIDGNCVAESECPCGSNEEYTYGNENMEDCNNPDLDCRNEYSYKRCTCVENFKRIDGVCVANTECPCPENSSYRVSNDCYETCGTDPAVCVAMDTERKCFCSEGYVRIDGNCVAESECPCGSNEEYTYGNEIMEDCNNPDLDCRNEYSYKRCTCVENFKRIDGVCVANTECPCPENSSYRVSNDCYETCGTDPAVCVAMDTERKCFCSEGYVRIDGNCVAESECPCGSNEEYTYGNENMEDCNNPDLDCRNEYSYKRCTCVENFKRIDGVCVANTECPCPENSSYRVSNDCYETCGTDPAVCVAMDMERKCFCSEGYVRIDGNCVAESECPCGSNEEYTYGNENMEDCNNPDLDCRNEYSYKRCTCVENFKRIDGVCVPNTECPCPENSSYRVSNDCYETCGTDPAVCVAMDMERKCFCSEGYVRIDGNCVAESECPCGSNEEYTYGNENMEDCNNPDLDCRNEYSYKRCTCVENFKRIDGVCVANTECPCPENSSYRVSNDCYETCGTDPAVCVAMDMERKCFCSEGYVRIDGNCVAESECPCGSNEEYTYGNENMEDCNNPDLDCRNEYSYKRCTCVENFKRIDGVCVANTECPCPENSSYRVSNDCYETCGTDPAVCVAMDMERKCFCSEGYVRIDGNCVAESECPCGSNEEYTYGNENMEDCNNPDLDCRNEYSYKRCTCVENFKRIDGVCVPNTECPCPENSSYRVSNDCYETCGTDPAVCVAMDTERKCFCSEGYVRIDGNCVAESECPCGSNEEYTYGNENMEDCNNPDLDCRNEYSYKRCTCVENFKRIDGVCVANTECPCPENSSYRVSNDCYETCGTDPAVCVAMDMERKCFCSEGYVRIDGNCVAESECPCGSNEEYTYGNENMEDCNNPDLDCRNEYSYKRCTCVENFKRIDGVCVANTECPCPENSSYRVSNDCYETCGTDPAVCVAMDMERKCFCSEGYVRIDGNCVAESECPCGSNEEYTYGNDCIENCDNSNVDCRNEYSYKRCTCLVDYKRIDGVCVLDTQCPCGMNEGYRFGSQCREDCRFSDADCLDAECSKGCFCNAGFKRFGDQCLPESQCNQCGENEEYKCDWECDYDCDGLDRSCREQACRPGCYCQNGFRRIDGVCSPQSNCRCRRGNEAFMCGTRCAEDCNRNPSECASETCTFGCYCRFADFRRVNGVCRNMNACRSANNG